MMQAGTDDSGAHARAHDHRDRVELSGDLTVKTARRLFDQPPRLHPGEVRMDLAAVREVDSAGLALLVHWDNLAAASAGKLTYTNAPAQLREMAKITGLEALFDE